MKFWVDFQRLPAEPWTWWVRRHQVKIFLAGIVLAIIF